MEVKIYPRNFPLFVRFSLEEGFKENLIEEALTRVKDQIVKVDDILHLSKDFTQDKYAFFFGELEGKIIQALELGPLPTPKILENTGLKRNTFYHIISQMIKEGMIIKESRMYGLRDPLYITYSGLRKGKSLGPEFRKTNGVSKDEVILALYIWPRYMDARNRDGIDKNHVYATQYNNIFSLAHAIKMWRKGSTNIPQWALISLASLTGLTDRLNSDHVIESYTLPPGIKIKPYFRGKYKIPIEAGLELDKIVIQLWSKGSNNGRRYNHTNKEDFFKHLHKIFGSFKSKEGRVPLAIVKIIQKHYEIEYLKKENARIPRRIIERLRRLKDPERARFEAELLGGIVELASPHREGCELTSRSLEFLHDTSRFLEWMGDGNLGVRKRSNRPHYRSNISSGKIRYIKGRAKELEEFYKRIERIYPDYKIWKDIPLNTIGDKIRKRDISNPLDVLEDICKDELYNYIGSILISIEKNTHDWGPGYFDKEDQALLTDHFWNLRKLPDRRSVKEHLRRFESPWFVKEPVTAYLFE